MGKFDGILIASDLDGTLCSGTVTQKNIEAIKYFQDNGGKFTICTGRNVQHFKQFLDIVKPNTYTIFLNGAHICDVESGEVLYDGFCDDSLLSVISKMLKI
jgi:HAD superfamily hydrolase (TIGR01484 family)